MLSEYLRFISYEINKIAAKSYPIQSIKRREQGTIVSILTINKEGDLMNIENLHKLLEKTTRETSSTRFSEEEKIEDKFVVKNKKKTKQEKEHEKLC